MPGSRLPRPSSATRGRQQPWPAWQGGHHALSLEQPLIARFYRLLNAFQPLDLLERIGEGIFALDPDWRFAYLNRQAERVLSRLSGTPSTDLLGTVIWDRPALADSSLGRALHRAYTDQTAVVHEVPDTGTRGCVEARVYPSDEG